MLVFTLPIPPYTMRYAPCSPKAINLIYTKTLQEKQTDYKLFKEDHEIQKRVNSSAFYCTIV